MLGANPQHSKPISSKWSQNLNEIEAFILMKIETKQLKQPGHSDRISHNSC